MTEWEARGIWLCTYKTIVLGESVWSNDYGISGVYLNAWSFQEKALLGHCSWLQSVSTFGGVAVVPSAQPLASWRAAVPFPGWPAGPKMGNKHLVLPTSRFRVLNAACCFDRSALGTQAGWHCLNACWLSCPPAQSTSEYLFFLLFFCF